jgi:hypothetical protein
MSEHTFVDFLIDFGAEFQTGSLDRVDAVLLPDYKSSKMVQITDSERNSKKNADLVLLQV